MQHYMSQGMQLTCADRQAGHVGRESGQCVFVRARLGHFQIESLLSQLISANSSL